ncbi:MAG: hypothetical protein ISR51_09655 [Rhodospirillales bacterium]|nr:hypothetical protein [Alphaproteobacteria bacterium]MBL6948926.1 hypothetical protein [Rhodospirillales bacterium]
MILYGWKNGFCNKKRLVAPFGVRGRASLFAALSILLLTAGCQHSAREQPISLVFPKVGTAASGSFTVAGKAIPLPAGDWTVIGSQVTKDGDQGYNTAHMLARIEGNSLHSAVEIYTNLPVNKSEGKGWLTVRSCTRDDMHFLEVFSNSRRGEQDCWWVNHRRMDGPRSLEHWKEARKYLSDNRIPAPLDMIAVSYRLANESDYLTVSYFFNPEKSGLSTGSDIHWNVHTWVTSVWHPDKVKGDIKKTNFIKALISWGKQWHKKVKASVGM